MEKFDDLWEKHQKELYFYIKAGVYQDADADDMLQDVAVLAINSWSKLRNPDGNLRAWLYKIAKNRMARYYETERTRKTIDTLKIDELLIQYENTAIDLILIKDFLRTLPEDWRIILHMNLYQGYSAREISELLKIEFYMVNKRISRAIKLMAKSIYEEGD